MAEANLRFSSIKDFDPAVIAMQIGAAAGLLEVREKLVARLLGKMTAAQLTQGVGDAISSDSSLAWLADSLKPASPAKPVDPGTLDKVLSGLDLGDGGAAPSGNAPKSAIGAAVASAAGAGNIPSEEAMAIRRTLGEVDRIVSSWLNAVLHLPDVQQTESIWRLARLFSSNGWISEKAFDSSFCMQSDRS
ncbi:MAG: type VI secretion system contractile sheath small subunit [Planctomycetes bacterium]|nr:type VI secretion system contractile sheath small subunit [Planctomycetota bacterium]